MQMDARVGALNAGHGGGAAAVDGGAARIAHHRQPQQGLQQQPQIGTWQQLLAGGVAGAVSKTCTAPLARLTILFQVEGMRSDLATLKRTSIWREASRIVCEEGYRAFWKGNLVTIAHRLPYSSISFYAYERYKMILQSLPGLDRHRDFVAADVFLRLLGGGLAGVTAASMTYPLDLVRTRLAAQTMQNAV
uniref:Mitochondrial substrate carrier family protein B n=1 Tax=Anthurium amnicola TaxID=1678845 RepID=A0A1D1YWS6_9ARAE